MNLYTKTNLIAALRNEILCLKYVKKDGTERVIQATLQDEYLPAQDTGKLLAKQSNERPDLGNSITIWDVENKGWRTLFIDNIEFIVHGEQKLSWNLKENTNGVDSL
jgi:hypothetical protein